MEYIQSTDKDTNRQAGARHAGTCIFCEAAAHPEDAQTQILFRGKTSYLILNRYPYTSGHLMIVPYDHQPSVEQLDIETRSEIMELTARAIQVLREVYHPDGFNLGANIGSAAGAGVAEHIHFHVVPRWPGDTNFMSAVGDTRVLPEALEITYQRLLEAWKQLPGQLPT
jgi:ATP adenylyltransferase